MSGRFWSDGCLLEPHPRRDEGEWRIGASNPSSHCEELLRTTCAIIVVMTGRVASGFSVAALLVGVVLAARVAAGAVELGVEAARAQDCPPGSAAAAWLRRVVEHAGYQVDGCTENAWIGVTPLTGFTIWATVPWRRPPGTRAYTEGLQNGYTDGTRLVWEAQGLAVWVAPGLNPSDRLPGRSALGALQAATFLAPLRYTPIRFMPTPESVLPKCRSDPSLARACPTRIPRVSLKPIVRWGRTYSSLHTYPKTVDGIFGIERRLQTGPGLIRPPILHVEIEAAAGQPRGFRFRWPTTGRVAARNGLLTQTRTMPAYFGRVTWGGKAGSLALSPQYPLGGSQADHVVFRWRSGRTTYLVGMHAWEPLTEAVATLRRIVASVPRG